MTSHAHRLPLEQAFLPPRAWSVTSAPLSEEKAARPLPDGDEFGKVAKDQGFTPHEAWELLIERQRWQGCEWVPSGTPPVPWMEVFKQHVRSLNTPRGWGQHQRFRGHWWRAFFNTTTTSTGGGPSQVECQRVLNGIDFKTPPITWENFPAGSSPDFPRPLHPQPKHWTADLGHRLLSRRLVTWGLQGLRWWGPVNDEAALTWSLYSGLRHVHRRLQSITGWPGPFLNTPPDRDHWLVLCPASPHEPVSVPMENWGISLVTVIPVRSDLDWDQHVSTLWLNRMQPWLMGNAEDQGLHTYDAKVSFSPWYWGQQVEALKERLGYVTPDPIGWDRLWDETRHRSDIWRTFFEGVDPLRRWQGNLFHPVHDEEELRGLSGGEEDEANVQDEVNSPAHREECTREWVAIQEDMTLCCHPEQSHLRPLDHPTSFVVDAAHNGFSPAEALALYQEKRLFQQHTLLAWDLVEPQWFADARAEISVIRSPREWASYLDRWSEHQREIETTQNDCPWAAMVHSLLFYEPTGEEDVGIPLLFSRRRKGDRFIPPSNHWGMPWTWGLVQQTIEQDWSSLPAPLRPKPERWTAEKGLVCLRRLMNRLGMAAIQWPWSRQDISNVTWGLFCQLRHFQQGLARITGWRGPLTGLGRGLWLRMGHESRDYGGGYACYGYGLPLICVSWTDWFHVLAHEWMHMFDSWLDNTGNKGSTAIWNVDRMESMKSSPRQEIQTLMEGLKNCQEWPKDHFTWLEEWREQVAWHPQRMDELNRWANAVAHTNAWVDRHYRRMFNRWGRHTQRRRHGATAVEPLLMSWAHASHLPLPWWDRVVQLELAEFRWMPQRKKERNTWWGEPCERLAVAFEGHLGPLKSHQVWLAPGLPSPHELMAHRPLWEAFFAALLPLWKESEQQMKTMGLREVFENRFDLDCDEGRDEDDQH